MSFKGSSLSFVKINVGLTQCSDGIDNDMDGDIDFPQDVGCADAADDDEGQIAIVQCNDGIDNDGDGLIDHPNDPGCADINDNDEDDDDNDKTFGGHAVYL